LNDSPRRAAVNGLALTGTNAHVILEEAPETVRVETPERSSYILPISAASEEALRQRVQEMAIQLKGSEGNADTSLADICYTAAVRRGHLAQRVALVGTDAGQIREQMEGYLAGSDSSCIATGVAKPDGGKVAIIFPGQGSQWIGMGRELLKTEPVFHATLEACDREIRRQAGWSLLEQLEDVSPEGPWARIDVIQPTLFAIEVALAALWRSWGLVPSAVVGHSMGEVAAAHVAGILSLEDAVTIICRRSSLMMRVAGAGAMVVIDLPQAEAEKAIERVKDRVSVAASNSPRSTVLSGDPRAIDEVVESLESQEIFCRHVRVDVASHSPQMDPLKDTLLAALEGVRPQAGTIPLYSTVRAEIVKGEEMDRAYWASNLRETVRFARVIELLVRQGFDTFIEMSPHPILLQFVEQTAALNGVTALTVASTRRDEPETVAMLSSLGQLYTNGITIDWKRLYPTGNLVKLPAYPWQRERFWIESSTARTNLHETLTSITSAPVYIASEQESVSGSFLKRWNGLATEDRYSALIQWLREEVAEVLFSSVDEVAETETFKSLGVNSLMTLELRDRIEVELGITLSAGTAWNYPTVAALAEHIGTRLASAEGQSAKVVAAAEPMNIHELSAAELLEAELAGAEMFLNR
jgi:acyl transferase domain-containing protein